jgi:hypothetical protein
MKLFLKMALDAQRKRVEISSVDDQTVDMGCDELTRQGKCK